MKARERKVKKERQQGLTGIKQIFCLLNWINDHQAYSNRNNLYQTNICRKQNFGTKLMLPSWYTKSTAIIITTRDIFCYWIMMNRVLIRIYEGRYTNYHILNTTYRIPVLWCFAKLHWDISILTKTFIHSLSCAKYIFISSKISSIHIILCLRVQLRKLPKTLYKSSRTFQSIKT